MIALLLATLTATAGDAAPAQTRVMYEYPYARTSPVLFREGVDQVTTWGPQTTWTVTTPDVVHNHGGAVLEFLWDSGAKKEPIFTGTFGGRAWTSQWNVEPLPFSATVVDLHMSTGVLEYTHDPRNERLVVRGFATGGGGLHLSMLLPTDWPAHLMPALRMHGGLGMVIGRGRVKVPIEGRAQCVLRADHYVGHAEIPDGAVEWNFWPGSASFSLNIGLQFDHTEKKSKLKPAPA